jgi:hypothetical protein
LPSEKRDIFERVEDQKWLSEGLDLAQKVALSGDPSGSTNPVFTIG